MNGIHAQAEHQMPFAFNAMCETWISPPSALSRKTVLPSEGIHEWQTDCMLC